MEDAYETAESQFGIKRDEWGPACGKYLPRWRGWFGFFGAEADFEAIYCPYCRVHLSGGEEP